MRILSRDWCVLPMAKALLPLLAVLFTAVSASAQDLIWTSGEPLVTPGVNPNTPATTGTLRMVSTGEERTFALAQFDHSVHFSLLRLSGERELPMKMTMKSSDKYVYEGMGNRLTISAVSENTVVAEYNTGGNKPALALLRVTSDSVQTSATLSIESVGLKLESDRGTLHVTAAGGQAFREQLPNGYRIVGPLDMDSNLRIAVSTVPMTPEEVEAASVSQAPAAKQEDRALAKAIVSKQAPR